MEHNEYHFTSTMGGNRVVNVHVTQNASRIIWDVGNGSGSSKDNQGRPSKAKQSHTSGDSHYTKAATSPTNKTRKRFGWFAAFAVLVAIGASCIVFVVEHGGGGKAEETIGYKEYISPYEKKRQLREEIINSLPDIGDEYHTYTSLYKYTSDISRHTDFRYTASGGDVYCIWFYDSDERESFAELQTVGGIVTWKKVLQRNGEWKEEGDPLAGTQSSNPISSSGSKKNSDPDASKYKDAEDFYDDYYDDFWDYEDAEDYYADYWD